MLAGVGFSTYANIEHGHIKNGMAMLGDMCDRVSVLEGEEASVEELQVDSMLTDTVLMLTAVGELCQNRQRAIVSLQTTRAIHKVRACDVTVASVCREHAGEERHIVFDFY